MFKRTLRPYIEEIKDHVSQELALWIGKDSFPASDDYARMCERHLKLVDLNRLPLDDLEKREREELLKSAYEIWKAPAFKYAIDQLIKAQIEETATKGIERDQYLMGRFAIAGMTAVRETISQMAAQFERLNKVDDFDPKSLM